MPRCIPESNIQQHVIRQQAVFSSNLSTEPFLWYKTPNHRNIPREHIDFSSTVTEVFHTNRNGSIFAVSQAPQLPAELDVPDAWTLGVSRDSPTCPWGDPHSHVPAASRALPPCTPTDPGAAPAAGKGTARVPRSNLSHPVKRILLTSYTPSPKTLLSSRWVVLFHRQESPLPGSLRLGSWLAWAALLNIIMTQRLGNPLKNKGEWNQACKKWEAWNWKLNWDHCNNLISGAFFLFALEEALSLQIRKANTLKLITSYCKLCLRALIPELLHSTSQIYLHWSERAGSYGNCTEASKSCLWAGLWEKQLSFNAPTAAPELPRTLVLCEYTNRNQPQTTAFPELFFQLQTMDTAPFINKIQLQVC